MDALARRARDAAAGATGRRRLRLGLGPGRPPWLQALPVPGDGVFPRHSLRLEPITVPGGLGAHKWADRRLLADAGTGAGGAEPLLVDLDGAVLESGNGNLFVVDGGTVRHAAPRRAPAAGGHPRDRARALRAGGHTGARALARLHGARDLRRGLRDERDPRSATRAAERRPPLGTGARERLRAARATARGSLAAGPLTALE